MSNNLKSRLKEIHDIVLYLDYNEDNFLDIINYIEEAITIAEKLNQNGEAESCLNNLWQTKEKQLRYMTENFKNEKERESYFNDVKENFQIDLICNCVD